MSTKQSHTTQPLSEEYRAIQLAAGQQHLPQNSDANRQSTGGKIPSSYSVNNHHQTQYSSHHSYHHPYKQNNYQHEKMMHSLRKHQSHGGITSSSFSMKNMQVVNDDEMQLLQINAMSQIFFQKIQNTQGANNCINSVGFVPSQSSTQNTFSEQDNGPQSMITLTGSQVSNNKHHKENPLDVFDQGEVLYSDIQVYKFIELFLKLFNGVTSDHLVVALIYIQRLLEATNKLAGEQAVLTDNNGKGVLHSALTLAVKFNLDNYEKYTEFYKAVLPFNMRKMRQMTDAFINFIEFEMYVSEEEFTNAARQIKRMVQEQYQKLGLTLVLDRDLKNKLQRQKTSQATVPSTQKQSDLTTSYPNEVKNSKDSIDHQKSNFEDATLELKASKTQNIQALKASVIQNLGDLHCSPMITLSTNLESQHSDCESNNSNNSGKVFGGNSSGDLLGTSSVSSNSSTGSSLASNAKKLKEYQERMQFLKEQTEKIKKQKTICTIF